VRAPADGYTLLLAASPNAINASLYERLSYNFIRDVAPVAYIADTPLVMVVPPRFPAKTVAEFIAYANATSGKLNMGSAGTGTPNHVAGELFKMATGTNLAQVQYRGEAPALADLLGAQVDVVFATLTGSNTSATRSQALPEIPVMADFVPGLEASVWFGMVAPKNTPVGIVERLNKEINAALADPTIKRRFADLGETVLPRSPTEFGKFIADETEKWGKVVKTAGIRVD
jgi:tripartite-type tricarboxylate transporter receptor subunit TctC